MNLKNYQKIATDDLIRHSNRILEAKDPSINTVVLDSIGGSGKTIMAIHVIDELNSYDSMDLVHIWLTPGKGELDKQSQLKISEFSMSSKCIVADELRGYSKLDRGTVVVINWEKLNRENNKLNQEGDYASFTEMIKDIKHHCKIVLWIDESHYAFDSEKAIYIRQEQINPSITIEMSATPILLKNAQVVRVDVEDVVRTGMIKKEIIINREFEGIEDFDDKDSLHIVMEACMEQREQLEKAYKKHGCNVVPLCLIQLPDAEKGEELKESVESILKGYGYSTDNGTVGIWLSKKDGENRHINIDKISENDNEVRFLVFKHAIALGWDCPRAHIMAILRSTKVPSFLKQVLYRLYRTAERKHYDDPLLDAAYVFTNVPGLKANIEQDAFTASPNRVKDMTSVRKDNCPELKLESFYKHKESQGDIDSRFYADDEGIDYIRVAFEDKTGTALTIDTEANKSNFENIIDFKTDYVEEIMIDTKLSVKELQELDVIKADRSLMLKLNDKDIRHTMDKVIKPSLNGFPPVRSLPTVRQALYKFFSKYFDITYKNAGAVRVQRIVVQNAQLFSEIMNTAIKSYKDRKKKKEQKSLTYEWSIPESDSFSSDMYEMIECGNYAMNKCCLKKKRPQTERGFEEILINDENTKWWYKNGDRGKLYFGISYIDINGKECSFYPDYITVNRDNGIGIWDTKSGMTAANEEAGPKSDALQAYIKHHCTKDRMLKGGIVVKKGEISKVFTGYQYKIADENQWTKVEI